jgi:hypothetical protein
MFAVVITELAEARIELFPDTAAYRTRRDAILARHGVTAEQVRAFVASYGRNEDVMSNVYRGVERRIDQKVGAEAVPPPSTGAPAPEEPEPSFESVPIVPDTTPPVPSDPD